MIKFLFTRKSTPPRELIIADAIQAMRDFCSAVEAGTITSKRTYARFKAIIARYDAL